jgi:hypothetical protein
MGLSKAFLKLNSILAGSVPLLYLLAAGLEHLLAARSCKATRAARVGLRWRGWGWASGGTLLLTLLVNAFALAFPMAYNYHEVHILACVPSRCGLLPVYVPST